MRLTVRRFSCESDYLRYPFVRRLTVLSAFRIAPYGVQPTIPSVGGSVTPRSRLALHGE